MKPVTLVLAFLPLLVFSVRSRFLPQSGLPFPSGRPPGAASHRRQGRLPLDGKGDSRSTARDICLSSGQFPPPAVRLFMIVGS